MPLRLRAALCRLEDLFGRRKAAVVLVHVLESYRPDEDEHDDEDES